MGIINPEVNAIPNYLWVKYQEGIYTALKATSTAQAAINSEYQFNVHKNLYRPKLATLIKQFVNVIIADVTAEDTQNNFDKTHIVTFNIDCYVRGENEGDPGDPNVLVPADEVAVERLHYLLAMAEFTITALPNYYMGLSSGQVVPDKITTTFNPVDDAEEAQTPYAPARVQMTAKFDYTMKDLELPALQAIKIAFENIETEIVYPV